MKAPYDDKAETVKRSPTMAVILRRKPSSAGRGAHEVVMEFANDKGFICVFNRTEAKAIRDWLSTKFLKR